MRPAQDRVTAAQRDLLARRDLGDLIISCGTLGGAAAGVLLRGGGAELSTAFATWAGFVMVTVLFVLIWWLPRAECLYQDAVRD